MPLVVIITAANTVSRASVSLPLLSETISVTISADLDHRHRDGEHERAERLPDPVRHDLGEVDRRQHRGGEEDADDDQHERRRLRSPRNGEHDERRHCRRVPEVHFLGRSIAGMAERTSYPPGTFSWAELATSDADAAKAFYGEHLWVVLRRQPGRRWAGLHDGARDGGTAAALFASDQPPHWNSYVTVASADDSAAKAGELGADVLQEPFDVMDVGRMAIFADPQGAGLCLWEPRTSIGATIVNAPGALMWNDLVTPDVEGVRDVLRRVVRLDGRGDPGRRRLPRHQERRALQRRHDAFARRPAGAGCPTSGTRTSTACSRRSPRRAASPHG